MVGVYLLHFDPPYRHARHYLGFSEDIEARIEAHKRGRSGQPLVRAALAAGTELVLTRLWEGADRTFERQLKNRKNTPQLCPRCNKSL